MNGGKTVEEKAKAFLDNMGEQWEWKDMFHKINNDLYVFSTGGLSDHEFLVSKMESNLSVCITSETFSLNGGHYIVAFGSEKERLRTEKIAFYYDFLHD